MANSKTASPATIKVKRSNGKTSTYKKVSCSTTAAGAKKKAEAIRKSGGTARVQGTCVYRGPKSKSGKAKK